MANTITARVLAQGTGDTPELIAWEIRYTCSCAGIPVGQFIAQVPREATDTEIESAIRTQTAALLNTLQTEEVFVESDVRGGHI